MNAMPSVNGRRLVCRDALLYHQGLFSPLGLSCSVTNWHGPGANNAVIGLTRLEASNQMVVI